MSYETGNQRKTFKYEFKRKQQFHLRSANRRCAIFGGVATRSFWLFVLLLLPPLLTFFFSSRALFFHYLALGLCGLYTLTWGVVGFLVGNLFSVGAGIALAVVFFIPALLYNWLAFCYFLYE